MLSGQFQQLRNSDYKCGKEEVSISIIPTQVSHDIERRDSMICITPFESSVRKGL